MKLFQNLFKPKWKHKDPSIRKQAIIELDKDDSQTILQEIVNLDENIEIQQLALKRINDLSFIHQIAQSTKTAKVKELASKMVGQILSGENKSALDDQQKIAKLQQINDQKLYEYIAENSKTTALRKSAIENISREALLGSLAISDNGADIRQIAANKLSQKSTLERVYRATKTRDKSVSRIVKDKLDQLIALAEKPAKLLADQKLICTSIENLGNKGLWERDKIQFDNYLKQWSELDSNQELELQARFDNAKTTFNNAYDAYLSRHEERLKEEAAFLPIKEEKQAIINQLHELMPQIDSLTENDEKELSLIAQTSKQLETNWKKLATLPTDIESEIAAQFNDILKPIKQAVQQHEQAGKVNKALAALKKDLAHHIKNPFKIKEKSLNRFNASFSELAIKSGNEATNALKQEIKALINQTSTLFSQQNTKIEKLRSELSSQLETLENHLSSGNLKDAISIRKTAQNNLNELEKYGAAQLKNFQNKLANASSRINELSNWRSWANTPQKELLIQKVESLIDSDESPKEIAFLISQARNDWKKLGPSEKESSQELWEKFSTVCDKAFEPCKQFFAEEAKLHEENQKKRLAFLENLESFLNQADWDNIDWKKVETLFKHARKEWQELGITDKDIRKQLNKRFYASYDKLKGILNDEWEKNAQAKNQLILETEALSQEEDLSKAISAAKSLQQRWKVAGRVPHSKERELWTKFKTLCDAVFTRREDLIKQKEEADKNLLQAKDDLVTQIEDFCNKPISEIGKTKNQLNDLQKELKAFTPTNQDADKQFNKRLSAALHIYERKLESLEKHEIVTELRQLKDLATLCEKLEQSIESDGKSDVDIITSQIEDIGKPKQQEWANRIQQRFQTSLELAQKDNAAVLLSQKARELLEHKNLATVQLEIIADIETPENASDERLKAQMQRLSDKLQNHSEESRWDSFLSAEVNWLTTGPVLNKDLESLAQRHNNAINALKSDYPEELGDY